LSSYAFLPTTSSGFLPSRGLRTGGLAADRVRAALGALPSSRGPYEPYLVGTFPDELVGSPLSWGFCSLVRAPAEAKSFEGSVPGRREDEGGESAGALPLDRPPGGGIHPRAVSSDVASAVLPKALPACGTFARAVPLAAAVAGGVAAPTRLVGFVIDGGT
jgi:hypothetical protein